MANVIRVDSTSLSSPNACVGSESFSYVSTGGVDDWYRWIWFFTILNDKHNKINTHETFKHFPGLVKIKEHKV